MKIKKWDVVLVVVVFLIAFFIFRGCESAEANTTIEVAVTADQGHPSGGIVIFNEVFDGKYALGIGWISPQKHNTAVWGPNAFVQIQRYVTYKRVTLGLGAAYWKNDDLAVQKGMYFTEMIRVNVASRIDVYYRHWSTGGSGHGGYDSLGIGLRW